MRGLIIGVEVGVAVLIHLSQPQVSQEGFPFKLEVSCQGKVGLEGRAVPSILGHIEIPAEEKRDVRVKCLKCEGLGQPHPMSTPGLQIHV